MKLKIQELQKSNYFIVSKKVITTFVAAVLLTSCSLFSSLTSNTMIKPNESFVLGKNEHGKFKAALKNTGATTLKVYHAPITGGTHSLIILKPQEKATIKADKNTAIIIENTANDIASVDLKVTGDCNLGMTYNNQ
jgi:hypothetical protein